MRKWLFVLWAALFFLFSGVAQAEDSVTITDITVDLWPEYDRPEMLVIQTIQLIPSDSETAVLRFRIPAAAGKPHAVATRNESGGLVYYEYSYQVEGEWATIATGAQVPEIRIEYYDPGLRVEGVNRSFEYHWPGDQAVESLSVNVQQPLGARELVINPKANPGVQGPEGLMHYPVELGSMALGESASVLVQYVKETDELSIGGKPVQPSAPISPRTSGRVTLMDALPWALGALGLILVVGGIWWYWHTGQRSQPRKQKTSRGKRASKSTSGPVGVSDEAVYCHQCGKRASTGDRFCRSCGSKLRV